MDITKLTGYTPGRWFSPDTWRGDRPVYAKPKIGPRVLICTMGSAGSESEEQANTEAVLAVPDLLTVAKMGLELAEYVQKHSGADDLMREKARALIDKAREL